jgi:hypothetical protein
VNTPSGQLTSEDADRLPADSAPLPQAFTPQDTLEAARGAESGCEPAMGLPSCGSLLGEFFALMGRIEADFTWRSDVTRLGDSMSAHQQDSHDGWSQSV